MVRPNLSINTTINDQNNNNPVTPPHTPSGVRAIRESAARDAARVEASENAFPTHVTGVSLFSGETKSYTIIPIFINFIDKIRDYNPDMPHFVSYLGSNHDFDDNGPESLGIAI